MLLRRCVVALLPLLLAPGCSSESVAPDEPAVVPNTLDATEALLVAPDELTAELQPLVDWKCQRGIPTRLVRLSEALSSGTGPDDAARLRSFLASELAKGTLRHVILGGDVEVMPARWVDIEYENELTGEMEYGHAATDLYFADLDGDWDPDGDGVYGELDDPADLLPDVSIGRLPISTKQEATELVDKVMRYERTPAGDYEDRVLLAAGYAGEGAYATVAVEYYVRRELPEGVPVTMLYEDAEHHTGSEMLTTQSMVDAFNQGHDIAFMMGHGSEESMGALSRSDVLALSNAQRPSIFVTCECFGGRFDYENGDSAGEEFVKGSTGGIAYIGSTDLGIGYPSLTMMMRDLTRCLYEDTNDNRSLGACFQSARRTFAKAESLHVLAHPDRWAQFVMVLLGDPTAAVWTARPRQAEMTITARNGSSAVDVKVVDADGAPIEDAIVTAYVAGASLRVKSTDASGIATIAAEGGSLDDAVFTASGRNIVPVEQMR